MIKTDLPVILLRGIILLPNNDIRLEFDNDISKNIIDIAELFHDNNILVVSQNDPLEESPNVKELPKIGVIAKISHKMELPNGKTRIIITGVKRARIYEYLNLNKTSEVLEAIASEIEDEQIDIKEEKILTRKLYRELEKYIKTVPYTSNSVLSQIINITNLSKLTDIVVPNLPVDLDRMQMYMKETSSYKRLQMILEDIYSDEEMFEIEKKLDVQIREELDNTQKEYMLREKIKLIKQELGEASVKEEEVDSLKERIRDTFFAGKVSFNDQVYITNVRHKDLLINTLESLKLVEKSLLDQMPEDFYSIDLMNAYEELGTIIGEAVEDDLVNEIFSKFCTGK